MNTLQASTSNNDSLKLCLNNTDISFLLRLVKKSEDILHVGQENLERIYLDINYACKYYLGFDPIETYKEIKKIGDIITKHENIEEEVLEGVILGYITKKDQPKVFGKLTKYREYLGQVERFKKILYK